MTPDRNRLVLARAAAMLFLLAAIVEAAAAAAGHASGWLAIPAVALAAASLVWSLVYRKWKKAADMRRDAS